MSHHLVPLIFVIPIAVLIGCSGTNNSTSAASTGGDGGSSRAGASTAGGASSSAGGNKTTGGTFTAGGNIATGGSNASGGNLAGDRGGASASGGNFATGGTTATGGTLAMGGSKTSGGTVANGAATAAGGSKATGGVTATSGNTNVTGGGTSDYPFCDYGSVPSATPPVWSDNPTLTPTGVNPYGKPSTTIPVGYILLNEGAQGTTQVPQTTQSTILTRINNDLKFETSYSYIHMPPWSTGMTGTHYIDYLFVGTGLPQDPDAGGDSAWEGSYPDVETTSVAMTDQSQRYDLTHEFNHVLENSYGTVPGQSVSWIQESYNDYLILLTAENANGATPGQATQFTLPSNVGYLDALVYEQPFAPIESCGVAVNDGSSVNGPGDYMADITGFRYNDLFPLFVAQRVWQHFFAAVWEQAKTTEQILQAMTRLLDKARVQCMVQEYGARLALGDFQELSASIQGVASTSMYQATTNQNGTLTPTNTNQLPRYTGRNNIPITVSSGATQVGITFSPDAAGSKGTTPDMRAQVVYRATDGTSMFGTPVASGSTSITLTKPPKNNVVIVVVTNVTMSGYKSAKSYGWDPNETFGYSIQVTGGTAAPTNRLYF